MYNVLSFGPITDVAPLTVHHGCAKDYMCIAYDTNTLRYKFYSAHTIFCSQTVKPLTCPCLYYIILYKFAGYKSHTILQRNGEMLKAWRDPQEMFS
jgi:hypothetical protein